MGGLNSRLLQISLVCALSVLGMATAEAAESDAKFAFISPSDEDSLRLYWLNKKTGQVGVCQYESAKSDGKIGNTKCFKAGEGAGPLGPGRYDLKASNHKDDASVFRVNIDTGDISICWVRSGMVVCTVPSR